MACKRIRTAGKWPLDIITLVLLFIGCAVSVRPQETEPSKPVRGLYPAAAFDIGGIESIDTTSGNLRLSIPLASLPAGRGAGFTLRLHYNSKLYDAHIEEETQRDGTVLPLRMLEPNDDSDDWAWTYGLRYVFHLERQVSRCGQPGGEDAYKFFLVFPDGNQREFRPAGYDDYSNKGFFSVSPYGEHACAAGRDTRPITYYSIDGSYLRLVSTNTAAGVNSWILYFPDGSTVAQDGITQRHTDHNGNYTDVYSLTLPDGNDADRVTDEWGRSITVERDRAANVDYVYTAGFGGEELRWTLRWGSTFVNRTYDSLYGCSKSHPKTLRMVVRGVAQIDLPQQAGGLSLKFGYNGKSALAPGPDPVESTGFGELSEVALPTGARVRYHYFHDTDRELPAWGTPCWRQVLKNYPVEKELIYRPEYELTGPPSNAPCDPAAESCAVETWKYDMGQTFGTQRLQTTITDPQGGLTVEHYYDSDGGSEYYPKRNWRSGLVYRVERPDGSVVERAWEGNKPPGVEPASTSIQMNPYVRAEYLSVPDAGRTALVKTAAKLYAYDKNGNVLRVAEYDWVPYGTPRDAHGVPEGATLLRETVNEYYNPTPEASGAGTDTTNSYHVETWLKRWDVLKTTEVRGGDEQTASRTEYYYDDATNTGNPTQVTSWDSYAGGAYRALTRPLQPGNSVSVTNDYDPARRNLLIRTTDARGVKTEFFYDAVNGHTDLYPTRTLVAAGTGVQRTTRSEYDFSSGAVTRVTDVDNNVSTATDYDALGRAVLVKAAVGLPEETRMSTTYSDIERRTVTRSDLETLGDGRLVQIQHLDQLGRVRLTRQLEGGAITPEVLADETVGVKIQSRYVNTKTLCAEGVVGSYMLTSNPYRAATVSAAGAEATMGWTLTKADSAGRVFETETISGAAIPSPCVGNAGSTGRVTSEYEAETTTVTDQAGRQRRSVSDALGRLAQVFEAPNAAESGYNYQSSYTYDALGNLTRVEQGAQARTFNYSSLSRLTSAQNPESGTVQYGYDVNGNLVLKIDPRPRQGGTTLPHCSIPYAGDRVATCYEYDPLGRVKSRTYNDGTPDVAYTYDASGAHSKGRLSSVSSSVSTYSYTAYDALGRVTGSSQMTDGVTYTMPDYRYNLAGGLISGQYPSGRVVKTEYDAAGRVSGVKNEATGLYYVGGGVTSGADNRIRYTAAGEAAAVRLGNGLWEHADFNSRLQLTQIRLGSAAASSSVLRLDYTYGEVTNGVLDATRNNGNVQSQTINVPAQSELSAHTFTQTYTYDPLNRLESAAESDGATPTWVQVYTYDRFGNRRLEATRTTVPSQLTALNNPVISASDNRIAPGMGYVYDDGLQNGPGNLTQMGPATHYTYDAENHITSYDNTDTPGTEALYVYDGSGRRVKKVVGPQTTVYVYDASGAVVAEYSNRAGGGGTDYLTVDTSDTRVVTSQSGGVISRHDYLPFGEEISGPNGMSTGRDSIATYNLGSERMKFASYERDEETKLDFAQARYFSSIQGRFTSPDPLLASGKSVNPQTWNRYAYAGNNPLAYADPVGLDWWYKMGQRRGKALFYKAEWKDRDPGRGYHRWSNLNVGFVFRDGLTGRYWALNPKANEGLSFATVEEAQDFFNKNYAASGSGLIPMSQGEVEFIGGVSHGMAMPGVGLVISAIHEMEGLDTTSRDYRVGEAVGMTLSGGAGAVKSIGAREGAQIVAAEGDDIFVIGRLSDTRKYAGADGITIINRPDWNMGLNDRLIGDAIQQKQMFYFSSSMHGISGTVTAHEIGQIAGASYKRIPAFNGSGGFFLVPSSGP